MTVRDDLYLHVPFGAEHAMTAQSIHFRMGVWSLIAVKANLRALVRDGAISHRKQFRDTEGELYGPTVYWREEA